MRLFGYELAKLIRKLGENYALIAAELKCRWPRRILEANFKDSMGSKVNRPGFAGGHLV
jgi:hypothetical protein